MFAFCQALLLLPGGLATNDGQKLITSAANFGLLGLEKDVELFFDEGSTNAYGKKGQWLLREREVIWKPETGNSASRVAFFSNATPISQPIFESFPCKDSEVDFKRVQPFITNSFRDIPRFQKRRCGSRRLHCGRIVLDDVIDKEVLHEVYDYKRNLNDWDGKDIVQRLMEKHFKTGPLVAVGGQLDHNVRADLPCEMHTDYLSRPPHYFLTAIIYLVDQGRECSRCETIFNDAPETGSFSAGAIVQPRKGRVALFSGGVENMHCKMPSIGNRDVVQIWFQCAAEMGRADL